MKLGDMAQNNKIKFMDGWMQVTMSFRVALTLFVETKIIHHKCIHYSTCIPYKRINLSVDHCVWCKSAKNCSKINKKLKEITK